MRGREAASQVTCAPSQASIATADAGGQPLLACPLLAEHHPSSRILSVQMQAVFTEINPDESHCVHEDGLQT
jgi:hypothetical protein